MPGEARSEEGLARTADPSTREKTHTAGLLILSFLPILQKHPSHAMQKFAKGRLSSNTITTLRTILKSQGGIIRIDLVQDSFIPDLAFRDQADLASNVRGCHFASARARNAMRCAKLNKKRGEGEGGNQRKQYLPVALLY